MRCRAMWNLGLNASVRSVFLPRVRGLIGYHCGILIALARNKLWCCSTTAIGLAVVSTMRRTPIGVVVLRHLRHVPPTDSIATVVNSLQNRVNNITLRITLNAKTGKIVLVKHCTFWLNGSFVMFVSCETVQRCLSMTVKQFDVSYPEKLLKIVATRGEIFSLKSTKYRLAAGLRPDPLGS